MLVANNYTTYISNTTVEPPNKGYFGSMQGFCPLFGGCASAWWEVRITIVSTIIILYIAISQSVL